jgi:hypothetical protein
MLNESFGTPQRRSERVLLRIPIRVEGKDTLGDAFDETTYTLVVNQSGGLIVVTHLLQPGGVVKITNLNNQVSCFFQVVMRAARSLSGTPEWGVKCLEPEVEIWGVHFPARPEGHADAGLIHVLLECRECSSREMAPLTVEQYRRLVAHSSLPRPCPKCDFPRDWTFAVIEVGPDRPSPGLPASSISELASQREVERRQEKRLGVKLPLGIRLPDGGEETSTTENISKTGLCFACNLELQVGERVYVRVGLDSPDERRDIPARIMWRRPANDKGRAFYGAKLEKSE